jgi:hypothetical protein
VDRRGLSREDRRQVLGSLTTGLPTFGCKANAGEGTDTTDSAEVSCIFTEGCDDTDGVVDSREREAYVRRRGTGLPIFGCKAGGEGADATDSAEVSCIFTEGCDGTDGVVDSREREAYVRRRGTGLPIFGCKAGGEGADATDSAEVLCIFTEGCDGAVKSREREAYV